MSTNKLNLSQTFDASPEDLWEAWTNPDLYAKWFDPTPGHDLTIYEFDVRVGGCYKFDMLQPDGVLKTQTGVFHLLNPYKEILLGAEDKSYLIHILFEQKGKKTKMNLEITGVPPEYQIGAGQVWDTMLKRLELVIKNIK